MFWRKLRRSDADRRQAEKETEDVRIHMRALTEELKRAIERLEKVADRIEGAPRGG